MIVRASHTVTSAVAKSSKTSKHTVVTGHFWNCHIILKHDQSKLMSEHSLNLTINPIHMYKYTGSYVNLLAWSLPFNISNPFCWETSSKGLAACCVRSLSSSCIIRKRVGLEHCTAWINFACSSFSTSRSAWTSWWLAPSLSTKVLKLQN